MAVTFTAAGTAAVLPINSIVQSGAMPAVDPSNLDTTVIASGAMTAAWITFAAGAQAGPNVPGCLQLLPGVPVLLTNNPAVQGGANVIHPDRGAGSATGCTIIGQMAGGTVTITRGTAVQTITF